jgi:radical SAM superfamily enzyme YgiQ (UPF0313 family)
MKIRFIESTRYCQDGSLLKARRMFYPSLTFPYLAALTPSEHELTMTHELLEDIDPKEKVDLVAMTSVTNNVLRAYEIADAFRRRGIPVAMGGFHASLEPEEALEHVDFVFVGEAEETWPRFLEDLKNGTPQRIYRADRPPSLAGIPIPDYSIIDPRHYVGYNRTGVVRRRLPPLIPVQTARGCLGGCDFCDVNHFHDGTYRARPVPEVVQEIRSLGSRFVCFVDDNIFADYARAKALFHALIPLKLTWLGQGTITAAEDSELMDLTRRSGCVGMLVGIESISQSSLESVSKRGNQVARYSRNLQVYKKNGIDVDASLVFGFDGEDPSVFDSTYRFLMENRIPFAGLQPLRPSPGTPLFKKLKSEGRLKEDKWWLNRDSVARVFDLKYTGSHMSSEEFSDGLFHMYQRFYSMGSILKRFLWPPQRRFPIKLVITFACRRKISRQAFISEH